MGGHNGGMRTGPGARDPNFRGIDPAALAHLIKQMQAASSAVKGWLAGHPPPPGVAATGYRQAADIERWATEQLGMLTRRHNYAVTHPDAGGGVTAPAPPPRRTGTPRTGATPPGGGVTAPVPPPRRKETPRTGAAPPGGGVSAPPPPRQAPRQPHVTPRGAGDLGDFPDRPSALRAGRADALAADRALADRKPVPDPVWKRLTAHADDPDYTEALFDRLGPAGAAGLLRTAQGHPERTAALRESFGTVGRHAPLDEKWLRTFLAQAERDGLRTEALALLARADLGDRTQAALVRATGEATTPRVGAERPAAG
ncbi:hypothetical protein DPM19_21520 [Actinomadura craniellae]|uniref:Uncharacterized protein n=1 Tax=Actinomadura craniellae TaxID=2231787 RepID=A0A365H1W0_9ACTN|nr:hypothetical protein [Actinomadura craniellae]RAY13080.1 hypothetical protein DPM19_21520 [Actinomadura craniellae]